MVRKIAVTLDERTVSDLDRCEREKRLRLARELAKIDPREERRLAEEGLGDRAWSEH